MTHCLKTGSNSSQAARIRSRDWKGPASSMVGATVTHCDASGGQVDLHAGVVIGELLRLIRRVASNQAERVLGVVRRVVGHASVGIGGRLDHAGARLEQEQHVVAGRLAGMRVQLVAHPPAYGVDAPAKLRLFVQVVGKVDHRPAVRMSGASANETWGMAWPNAVAMRAA